MSNTSKNESKSEINSSSQPKPTDEVRPDIKAAEKSVAMEVHKDSNPPKK